MLKLHEYKCPECKKVFEEYVENIEEVVMCPKCNVPAERIRIPLSQYPKRQDWRVN